MQLSSVSTSYTGGELQRLLGLQRSADSEAGGQNLPEPVSGAKPSGPPPGPPPPRPDNGSSDQFTSDTLSSLLRTQEESRPSASDIASRLISDADSDGDGALSADEISTAISGDGAAGDLSEALSSLDTDGDSLLSADELTAAIEEKIASQPPPPMRGPPPSATGAASNLLSAADSDEDGLLSADEIASSTSDAGGTADSEAIASAISALDTNGDGFLSADELSAAIEQSFAQNAANAAYRSTQDGLSETSSVAEAA